MGNGGFDLPRPVLVTGAHGFLGRHVVLELLRRGASEGDLITPRSTEADLRERSVCARVVRGVGTVIHVAGRIGGIGFNQERPGELFFENAIMGLQLMEEARRAGVERFLTVGTACEYPKVTPVPFREENLWNGYPDEITGPYGLAKKMLLVQGQTYRRQYGFHSVHVIPANLYGPGDHFDETHGHVIPSLIKRFVEAADAGQDQVTVWGTGRATREFLYVEDAAEGIVLAAERYDDPAPMNLGSGLETPIRDLVHLLAGLTGFRGEIVWDATRPDGQPRRSLDVTRARQRLGFAARTPLEEGLRRTVAWYRKQVAS